MTPNQLTENKKRMYRVLFRARVASLPLVGEIDMASSSDNPTPDFFAGAISSLIQRNDPKLSFDPRVEVIDIFCLGAVE